MLKEKASQSFGLAIWTECLRQSGLPKYISWECEISTAVLLKIQLLWKVTLVYCIFCTLCSVLRSLYPDQDYCCCLGTAISTTCWICQSTFYVYMKMEADEIMEDVLCICVLLNSISFSYTFVKLP